MKKKLIYNLIISFLLAIGFSVYDFLVKFKGDVNLVDINICGVAKESIVLFVAIYVLLCIYIYLGKEIVFKYRFLIAFIAFVLCIIFGINGSSVGYIHNYFGTQDNGVLFGLSRGVRADEWAIFTPMTWSQYIDPSGKFSYFNSIVRAESTDVFIEYGQPIFSWLMIYRPFQLGYLFLPLAQGMSFFWCGRIIALFMVSFEFARLLTNDNRKISVAYSFLIAFSPVVQWWFAINGFVEMLIALQLSIVLLQKYIKTESYKYKVICSIGITICAGCYALTMYPAWMIPFAYILLVLIIWIILENKNDISIKRKDILLFVFNISVFAISMAYVYVKSKETISIISNTVYPGKRFEIGGGILYYLMGYISSIWYVFSEESPLGNVTETSYFISLFPVGLLLYCLYRVKGGKSDRLCYYLIFLIAFLFMYCTFGLPPIIAKISFMGSSLPNRTIVPFGFANILLLFRTIELIRSEKIQFALWKTVVGSVVLAISFVWMAYVINKEYYSVYMIVAEIIIYSLIIYGCFDYNRKYIGTIWVGLIIIIAFISGGLVNPIRRGVQSVEEIPYLKMIEAQVKANPEAKWIVEGVGYPITEFPILKGARTLNSTNIYPDLERWAKIDKTGEYNDIYNRYSHIQVFYGENEEKFQLLGDDCYLVYLNYDDLKKLDVDYIFTCNDFSKMDNMSLVSNYGAYSIYKVD